VTVIFGNRFLKMFISVGSLRLLISLTVVIRLCHSILTEGILRFLVAHNKYYFLCMALARRYSPLPTLLKRQKKALLCC